MTTKLRTRIGKTPVDIAVTRYPMSLHVEDFPDTRSAASYFVGDDYPARQLVTVEGATVGDVLAQAYQDLA